MALGDPRRLPRRGRAVRHPQDRRLQPRRQRGLRLLPGDPEARRALERRQGLPAPGAQPAEPDRADRRAGEPARARGRARATGVDFRRADGQRRSPRRGARSILAAGAIGSPLLLQLSGIGPAALLQRAGITVRARAARRRREPAGPPAAPRWSTRCRARGRSTSVPPALRGKAAMALRIRAVPRPGR